MEVSLREAATAAVKINALARVATTVEPQLAEVSARIARQVEAFDPAIEGYINYALESSGKQLRPLLTLLAAEATGNIACAHVDLAVIIELIHLATLVHDDIMDEAERRRGQPTLNARWGNALSVLLGDALFAHALDLSTRFDDAEISRAIARATRDVCTGEIIQTQRRFDLHLPVEEYFRIIELKTATLFSTAARLGAKLNKASAPEEEALARFGKHLGAAYQIYDDCIDVAGRENITGKTLGTDLRKGKMTLPLLRLLHDAPALEKERYCELILEGDREVIAGLLQTTRAVALNCALAAATKRLRDARNSLETLPESQARDALFLLADTIGEMVRSLRPRRQ